MIENKFKAWECEGPKVLVRVCASKTPGFPVAHLGGYYKYDVARGLEGAVPQGDMSHHSGYPFPADGKFHEYEFPKAFVERCKLQAAEIPEQFEIEVIEAAPKAPAETAKPGSFKATANS